MHEELEEVEPNCLWKDIKHAILREAHDNFSKKQITKKSPWLSSIAINIARDRQIDGVGDSNHIKSSMRSFKSKKRQGRLFEQPMQYNTEIQSKFHNSLQDNERNHRKKDHQTMCFEGQERVNYQRRKGR